VAVIFQWLISLDHSVFHFINSIAGRNSYLDWVARVGADDHIVPVALALLVLATLLIARKHAGREKALLSVICALAASAVSMIILFALNNAFFRPRPFTSQAVHLLFYHNTDSAFPSNAATLAFAMAVGIFLYWRKLGILMLVLAAYISLARVFVGIHYPLDVVGGLLLGGGSAVAVRLAEPAYAPLARWLNSGLDRLLASWKWPARAEHAGGGNR
jgi:undecaprenyl-diphosphatase